MNRRLHRCRHDRRLAGVAGGLAEFFDLDPTIVRIIFVLSVFLGGLGVLIYIALALVVPLEPLGIEDAAHDPGLVEGHRHAGRGDGPWTTVIGVGLILFGSLALIDRFLPALDVERVLVPAIMIGIGAFLVAMALRRREPMNT